MKKVKVILRDRINKNTLWVEFAWCFDSLRKQKLIFMSGRISVPQLYVLLSLCLDSLKYTKVAVQGVTDG